MLAVWSGLYDFSGAVGFTPKTQHLEDLDEYISQITKNENEGNYRNPWFAEYISDRNNCTLVGMFKCGLAD